MSQTDFERGGRGRAGDRELVLSVGTYAYTQDITTGVVRVYNGPIVVNVSGQETPVDWNVDKGRFEEVALDKAARISPVTPQGYYCELYNPAAADSQYFHPEPGGKSVVKGQLRVGEKINIPGPTNFALWPQQHAKVIKGHNLRSNQYLQVRIYDEDAARANWASAVVRIATNNEQADGEGKTAQTESDTDVGVITASVPEDLSVGKVFIVKGTEVSFYIPPTGVEVVPFTDSKGKEQYVRDALSLERLEYCILVGEDGEKRFERGPAVVFPRPTETFFTKTTKKGQEIRSFRPIELNAIQGIYVKVIQEYEENGRTFKEGEELFITGKDTPIYFPRVEHSLVKYDNKTKHYATSVPKGEGRYVMNRNTGEIGMVTGPTMLLPDPRNEVIVRRVLSDWQCKDWYPNNTEALEYNRGLRELASRAPTTRRGVVSEGEVSRSKKMRSRATTAQVNGETAFGAASYAGTLAESGGDEFSRGSTYTQPRTITLDTKFQGVPYINLWTGYAVMVVDKSGNRRVEVGPTQILMQYDEDLEILKMSTGKPKTTDNKIFTPYLRVKNNKVSDLVSVETRDHVPVNLKLSFLVNFEGDDPTKWFDVENYVKFMCDHVRSVLKSAIRKLSIEEFYATSEDIVRDTILGKKAKGTSRNGMFFSENSMRVADVEVLNVEIPNASIAKMLIDAQHHAVQSTIALNREERDLRDSLRREEIRQKRAAAEDATATKLAEFSQASIQRNLETALKKINAAVDESKAVLQEQKANEAVSNEKHQASLDRKRQAEDLALKVSEAKLELKKAELAAETAAMTERFKAATDGGMAEMLVALDNKDTMVKLAQALSIQRQLGGESFVEVVQNVLGVSPEVAKSMAAIAAKAGYDFTQATGDNGIHAK